VPELESADLLSDLDALARFAHVFVHGLARGKAQEIIGEARSVALSYEAGNGPAR